MQLPAWLGPDQGEEDRDLFRQNRERVQKVRESGIILPPFCHFSFEVAQY